MPLIKTSRSGISGADFQKKGGKTLSLQVVEKVRQEKAADALFSLFFGNRDLQQF